MDQLNTGDRLSETIVEQRDQLNRKTTDKTTQPKKTRMSEEVMKFELAIQSR
jgi:hypothetical protein